MRAAAYTREDIEMLEAMGLGPVWLLRDSEDPMVPKVPAKFAPAPRAPQASRPKKATQPLDTPDRAWSPAAERIATAQDARRTEAPRAPAGSSASVVSVGMPEELAKKIAAADWSGLKALAQSCSCCSMATTRHHVVFSQGDPGPKLVVIGEAPGAEEDLQGLPFVGKSGKLLTAMLDSLGIVRGKDCVVLNVLKCRPPGNRNPDPAEIVCCAHWLMRQLELLEPDVLLLSGRFAISTLLKPEEGFSIGRMRGRIHAAELPGGRKVAAVATYHPSYLLRTPEAKAKSWEDLLLLKEALLKAGIELSPREKRWD